MKSREAARRGTPAARGRGSRLAPAGGLHAVRQHPAGAGARRLPPEAPAVDVQIFDLRPEEALAGLEHGTIDVALMTTSDHELSAKLNRAAVNMQPLGEVEIVAVLPPRRTWPKTMT
ncbi:hypothetical protein GCM10022221_69220 [Actinocorallia aurea]